MRQLILDLLPEAPPRLDNFVTGGNGEALTGFAAWLTPESTEFSLLLWGESGAGKSHLLRASNAHFHDAHEDPDLAQIGELQPFHAVDNVEALSDSGQIALFNLFNRLRAAGITTQGQAEAWLNRDGNRRTILGTFGAGSDANFLAGFGR